MFLLDTHVLVWLAAGLPELGPVARAAAAQGLAGDRPAVSAIAFWEVAMLQAKGRLRLAQSVDSWRTGLLERGLTELAVTGVVGIAAARRDDFHADPADRVVIATAALERATLVTADQRILDWPGPLRRLDARR